MAPGSRGVTPPPGARLRLVRWSPDWAHDFAAETQRIRAALGPLLLRVEHVGSTSVPGLLAKPVIDLALAVDGPVAADAAVAPLERLGYRHRGPHGDDPRRRYFVLDRDGARRFQIHLWMLPARGWEEHLAFRDLLRGHPELAGAYAREKLRVADEVRWDKRAYSEAKGPFIERLLREHGIRPRVTAGTSDPFSYRHP